MRVAVLGRTRMLYDTIEEIVLQGHEIVLIGTCPAAPEYDITEKDFEDKARKLGIPFFNNVQINSPYIVEILKKSNADIAISVNWITVIKSEACECFKYGILNAHCGDLPRYRGNATPNWAILNGERQYAISIHYMEPGKLDSGDIVLKEYFQIDEQTTVTEIYENMNVTIPKMFGKAIDIIDKEGHVGVEQSKNIEDSLRCYPRIPSDSFIDWNENCDTILKNIRASSHPFQGAFCFWDDLKIYIFDAEIKSFETPCLVCPGQVIKVIRDDGIVEVAASDGVIALRELWINNERFTAADVLKSVRIRLNYCLPNEIYLLRNEINILKKEIEKINAID